MTVMTNNWTRRRLLLNALAGGVGASLARVGFARGDAVIETPTLPTRTIHLLNTHTGESVSVVYRRGDEYDAAGLATLAKVLRDHRNGESHAFDPALFDQLHDLALAAHCEPHYEIISGYRSPESNAKMHAASDGVAKRSLHMQGKAIDVRLKGCACDDLRDLALAAAKGGVGYYKRSDFVHIDTGRFRSWIG